TDRGSIAPGKAADLVIFDPEQVRARATYPAPIQLADGFDVVLVNGEIAFESGAVEAVRSGLVLRPSSQPQQAGE
ncbi:MAG: D-aminoacylase, partial [Pseudomonadales bacterium]|nr:D-aminoacylase [Pseudomonadales bacterium]